MEHDASQRRESPANDSDVADDAAVDDPTFISPQDFYREAVQREDIRRILAALAK